LVKSLPNVEVVILFGNQARPEFLVTEGLKDKLVLESQSLSAVQ
jgi:hypothetical protein